MTYSKKKYGENHVNARFFAQLLACVAPLIDMRNAVEHPGKRSGTLITDNIALNDQRELAPPTWRREKDAAILYGPLVIIDDMAIGVRNLLILAETVVVMWARDNLSPSGALDVIEIPEAKVDPNFPIKYKIMPSAALLQTVQSVLSQSSQTHS
jgi:hypothetical protein